MGRGATSFGPVGRLVATAIVLWLLVATIMTAFFLSILGMLLASVVLLRDIWKRDWIVPEEHDLPSPPADRAAEVVAREEPRTTAQTVWRWTAYAAVVTLGATFAYGPVPAKATAMALATLVGFTWFLRGFLSR